MKPDENEDLSTLLTQFKDALQARQIARADSLCDEIMALHEEMVSAAKHPLPGCITVVTRLYEHCGLFEQAERVLKWGIGQKEKEHGPEHEAYAYRLVYLAQHYANRKNYADAEPFYIRALAVFEQTLCAEHEYTRACCREYSEMLKAMGRPREAYEMRIRGGTELPQSVKNVQRLLKQITSSK